MHRKEKRIFSRYRSIMHDGSDLDHFLSKIGFTWKIMIVINVKALKKSVPSIIAIAMPSKIFDRKPMRNGRPLFSLLLLEFNNSKSWKAKWTQNETGNGKKKSNPEQSIDSRKKEVSTKLWYSTSGHLATRWLSPFSGVALMRIWFSLQYPKETR